MRKVYILSLLLLSAGVVNAQKSKSYTSGLKAGVNLYNLKVTGQPDVSADMRTSFHAGLFYNVPITSMFSIQPEILYSGEGANFKSSTAETETVLNYLSIPVMFQLNTQSGFYAETGPVLGIMAKGKETITTSAATSKLDLKKQIKKTNIAWAAGIGYKMKNIGFNARYNFGLSDLAKISSRPETKSRGLQVGVSWSFQQ